MHLESSVTLNLRCLCVNLTFLRSKCYADIFCGKWESHDPFNLSHRGDMMMGNHEVSFFRAFQGWTALTASGPGDGTLTLLPNVKEATAFLLLRPLRSVGQREIREGFKKVFLRLRDSSMAE